MQYLEIDIFTHIFCLFKILEVKSNIIDYVIKIID